MKTSTLLFAFIFTLSSCQKQDALAPPSTKIDIHSVDGTYLTTYKGSVSKLHYCIVSENGKKLFNPFYFNKKDGINFIPDTLSLFINPIDSTFPIPPNVFYALSCNCLIIKGEGKFHGDTITISYSAQMVGGGNIDSGSSYRKK